MIEQHVVEEIVAEIVKKLSNSNESEKPLLLIVHASKTSNSHPLQKLSRYWRIVEFYPESNQKIPENIAKVVFLGIDQDSLVKSAIGITDTPVTALFSKLIMQCSDVCFVVSDSLEFMLQAGTPHSGNQNYRKHIEEYKKKLQHFGVSLTTLEMLIVEEQKHFYNPAKPSITEFFGKLITQQTVENLKTDYISVSSSTIITPLAQDTAKELNITIEQQKK